MKKLFLFAACALFAVSASAQRAESHSSSFFSSAKADQPITFGVRAGVNFSGASLGGDLSWLNTSGKTGFHVGMNVDFPLLESFYLQSGLYLTTKGTEATWNYDDEYEKITLNPYYLEIPINASYRYNFSEKTQLQVNVGPYLAFGLGGKVKYTYVDDYVSESDSWNCFKSDDERYYLKRFDAGLNIGTGVTISKFYVGINYSFGFVNVLGNGEGGSMKNSNFTLSVGYNF